MAKDKTVDRKTRNFVKPHIDAGRSLIEAIEQRENTLLRVINVAIEAQRGFLDDGPQLLKPLPTSPQGGSASR